MAPFILSVRPEPDCDLDVAALARRGVPALAAPLLAPRLIGPDTRPDPAGYSGVVFTSRHAVTGLVAALGGAAENVGQGGWSRLPVFAVGRATARVARMAGFAAPQVGHGGGAGLVPLICAHIPANAPPLLWPAARDRGFDMVAALAPDRAVEDVSVYAMEQTPRLSDDALDALAYGKILAVKLMSARSATLFCAQLAENGMDHCRPEIIIIAGSETIAAAAGRGWRQTYIAKRPTRVRLLAIASLLYHRREVLD